MAKADLYRRKESCQMIVLAGVSMRHYHFFFESEVKYGCTPHVEPCIEYMKNLIDEIGDSV